MSAKVKKGCLLIFTAILFLFFLTYSIITKVIHFIWSQSNKLQWVKARKKELREKKLDVSEGTRGPTLKCSWSTALIQSNFR